MYIVKFGDAILTNMLLSDSYDHIWYPIIIDITLSFPLNNQINQYTNLEHNTWIMHDYLVKFLPVTSNHVE